MAADITYKRFVERWQQVTELPPQTLGPLTPYYKRLVKHLKVMPWPLFLVVSVVTVVGLYFLVGSAITLLVSLLQKGF